MEQSHTAATTGGAGKNKRNKNPRKKRTRRRNENARRNNKKGGGSRSKRGGGGGGSSNNARSNAKKGPPSPPQTKIVIRNIGDVKRYGSVQSVIDMIRTILECANQKMASTNAASNSSSTGTTTTTTSLRIQLDESSVKFLLEEEREILKALEKEEEKAENTQDDGDCGDETNAKESGAGDEVAEENKPEENTISNSEKDNRQAPTKFNDVVRGNIGAGVAVEEEREASTTNLAARVIYIVPPKETRRRGTKPGCAYLVISGPRIEAKETPSSATTTPTTKVTDTSTEAVPVSDVSATEEKTGDATSQADTKADTVEDEGSAKEEDAPALVTEGSVAEINNDHHVTIVDPKGEETVSATTAPASTSASASATTGPLVVPPPDYSREVAKGRFLVLEAIELLAAHTKEDAKGDQVYAGSMVEVAMSGKTYKHKVLRRDRTVGTLESSADYKSFIDKKNKEKEEIMARPKPAPGGGALASSNATAAMSAAAAATSVDVTEDGIPIAALVAHIRSKHEEAAKRKKAKKKAKDSANKEKGGNAANKSSRRKKGKDGTKEGDGGKKGRRKRGDDGRKKARGNKKRGTKAGAAPSMLLKPNGTAPAVAGANSGGGTG